MLFDEEYYLRINEARWRAAEALLERLRAAGREPLSTCLDIGCGPGWFSDRLCRWGLSVHGLEGRPELIAEARRRVPAATFDLADIESDSVPGRFEAADLVFCFGLIYHTENPFRAVRNLHALTRGSLLVESILVPGPAASFHLQDEGANETQGLTYHSLVPSRASLAKMLQCAGFGYVYEYGGEVDHDDFRETETMNRRRGIFLARSAPLPGDDLRLVPPVAAPKYDFGKRRDG
jgi:trans-aconitate methyltransferase